MRKVYTILLMLAFFVTAGYSQLASWQNLPDGFMDDPLPKSEYDVLKISGFDYLSDDFDTFWSLIPNLDTISYVYGSDQVGGADDGLVIAKSAWDDDYLYIGFKVTDDYIAEPSDSIQDYFEIYWATYPEYWNAIMDTATDHKGYIAAHARWDTTGSRKTGNWQLISGSTANWDDYRVSWSWDPWGPSATPWAVGWGSPADEYLLDQVYEKVDDNNYNYLAVIPWFDAMEGFIPKADTSLSMEMKLNDVDPAPADKEEDKTAIAWGTGQNDAYWTCFYAGIFNLYEDLAAPVLSDVTASVDTNTETEITATSDEDAMLYLVPEGTTADKASVMAAAVVEASATAGVAVVMDVSAVDLGLYDLYAIDISNNLSAAAVVDVMSTVGISENRARLFNVYPNPADDNISISNAEMIQKIEITNVLGQSIKVISQVTNNHNISDLKSGVYFLIIHADGDVITKRIVKK